MGNISAPVIRILPVPYALQVTSYLLGSSLPDLYSEWNIELEMNAAIIVIAVLNPVVAKYIWLMNPPLQSDPIET